MEYNSLIGSPSLDDVSFASTISDLSTISSIEVSNGDITDGYCIEKEMMHTKIEKVEMVK